MTPPHPFRALFLATLLGIAGPSPMEAQEIRTPAWSGLGDARAETLRRDQLLGDRPLSGWMMRTPSSLLDWPDGADPTVLVLLPSIHTTWNSTLPSSFNDGALWAGRGWNTRIAAGVALKYGRLRLVVAPELLQEENLPFQVVPFDPRRDESRDPWSHPFHPLPESLDQPIRFGREARTRVAPGQSSLTLALGSVSVGATTQNAWWGPGLRNGLVLSNQAAGFPRLFVGSAAPVNTPLGEVEGRLILGRLQESEYFDDDPTNDHRTLSGLIVTLRPAFDPRLTVGAARTVFAPLDRGSSPLGAGLDVFRDVGRPNSTRDAGEAAPDQISALFARWVFPEAGFEAFVEWARFEQPTTFGDFLEFPQHSQGYTYGLQWVRAHDDGSRLSIQAEYTNLEPSSTWRNRYVYSSYTSRVVPQGYTHRGQVLGASIGPGSSGQWLAVDHMDDSGWSAGAFGGRIRWDAAAHFRPVVPGPKREDLSLYAGLRGSLKARGWLLSAELSRSIRINYLFQTFTPDPVTGRAEGVDVANTSISLRLSRDVGR